MGIRPIVAVDENGPGARRAAPATQQNGEMMPETLLLYLPVPLCRRDGVIMLEDQACNGLRLWAQHFDRLLILQPLSDDEPPPSWVPIERVGPALERIEFVTLPLAYRPDRFLRALPRTLPLIRQAIARADLVGFAIGGLFGDWGSVGAWAAHRMGKPFYIWTDRVESEVMRRNAHGQHWRRRLRARLEYRPMAWQERALIRRAALGLFHGRETFDTYAPYCRNPQLVHDIHLRKADHITPAALQAKLDAPGGRPLQIIYAGRADVMKGATEWLDVLESLAARGVDFNARWLGDGPLLEQMRARVADGPLAGRVELPGFVADRQALLEGLRAADLLLFCHMTPESPRVLIEALASACPIIGHDSAYPADLIATHGGGLLTPTGDCQALADTVAGLAGDPARLRGLIAAAARDGAAHDDETVFAHRSELIRQHLPRARPAA